MTSYKELFYGLENHLTYSNFICIIPHWFSAGDFFYNTTIYIKRYKDYYFSSALNTKKNKIFIYSAYKLDDNKEVSLYLFNSLKKEPITFQNVYESIIEYENNNYLCIYL